MRIRPITHLPLVCWMRICRFFERLMSALRAFLGPRIEVAIDLAWFQTALGQRAPWATEMPALLRAFTMRVWLGSSRGEGDASPEMAP